LRRHRLHLFRGGSRGARSTRLRRLPPLVHFLFCVQPIYHGIVAHESASLSVAIGRLGDQPMPVIGAQAAPLPLSPAEPTRRSLIFAFHCRRFPLKMQTTVEEGVS
jgi:hypothetical protein